MKALFLMALAVCNGAGQISAPVMGYSNAGGKLRPILGIPGAARLGGMMNAERVSVAPGHQYAISGREILDLAGGVRTEIPGWTGHEEVLAFSPTGAAVAIRRSERLLVYSGLPAQPQFAFEAREAAVGHLAVADDGSALLSVRDDQLALYRRGSEPVTLHQSARFTCVAFTTGQEAYYCDGNRVFLLSNWVEGPLIRQLPAIDGLLGEFHLSRVIGGTLLLASSKERRLITYEDGESKAFELPCSPSMLEPGRLAGVLLVCAEDGEPLWVVSRKGADLQLNFIPAGVEELQ